MGNYDFLGFSNAYLTLYDHSRTDSVHIRAEIDIPHKEKQNFIYVFTHTSGNPLDWLWQP